MTSNEEKNNLKINQSNPALSRYFHEINHIPLLSKEEEQTLATQIKEGHEDSLKKLVESNLKFVVAVAKSFQDRGLPLSDLISEGNLGLIEAARRFDEKRGIKFISYAVWWIRQSILKALARHARTVRYPLSQLWTFQKAIKAYGDLQQILGRSPTLDELAQQIGSTTKKLVLAMESWEREIFLEASLNGSDNELRLIDRIENELAHPPDFSLIDQSLKMEIGMVLATLPPREAEVLRLYYGIDQPRPMTLLEIGAQLDLSRERIRQLKNRALKRLRLAKRREKLRTFLG
ncbi:RNA polymerase sigma factor RpoD/SigA [candidate division KSB1 bacterium]|nr:RNA polymerase sigma factor RpoD/SigA [candidate division KSB1 bacterium]